MLRRILLLSAAWLCLVGVGPANAQPYAPPTLTVSDTTPVPGQTITISGTGFPASTTVTITINPTFTATSDASGAWSTSFIVPTDLGLGTHTITATAGTVTATTTFTVVAGETTEAAATLPTTGSGTSDMLRWGVGLLACGGVLVGLGRRRSHRTSESDA